MKFLFGLLSLLLALSVSAHPEGFSGLKMKVSESGGSSGVPRIGARVRAVLTLHTRDMGEWFSPSVYKDYVKDVCAALAKEPGDLVEVNVEGNAIAVKAIKVFSPEVGLVEVDLDYELPAGAKEMQVWSRHLANLPWGHQQVLIVEDEKGKTLCNQVLTLEEDSAEIEMTR